MLTFKELVDKSTGMSLFKAQTTLTENSVVCDVYNTKNSRKKTLLARRAALSLVYSHAYYPYLLLTSTLSQSLLWRTALTKSCWMTAGNANALDEAAAYRAVHCCGGEIPSEQMRVERPVQSSIMYTEQSAPDESIAQ
ncbi:hypothetical protein KQX54_004982 [Cotesia glomerata]|uniref:Uncharacterized protein n=1 Tax=Cotesia glomerata TaxID=32391 RepID=A0AAV7J666_COTGL|nr:hypothetical protein KQX54_004982 [Cotesia glomerata]